MYFAAAKPPIGKVFAVNSKKIPPAEHRWDSSSPLNGIKEHADKMQHTGNNHKNMKNGMHIFFVFAAF